MGLSLYLRMYKVDRRDFIIQGFTYIPLVGIAAKLFQTDKVDSVQKFTNYPVLQGNWGCCQEAIDIINNHYLNTNSYICRQLSV